MSPLPRPLYHGGMLTGSTSSTSSSVAVTSTAILHDLLLTYSLLEAEPFELLSLERVAELRQEQHRLTASLQDVQERISLEKKMRGATHRLHASGQNAPSAPTLVRREDVTMAMERTDEVMQQYMQVSDALCDVQRQLLSHHIAVLRDHIQSEHHAASESSSVHAFVTPRRTTSSTMPLTPRRCRDRPTASPTARSARLDALLMHEQDASPSPQRRNLQRRLSQLCAEHTTLQDWWMAEKPTHRVLRDYIRDMQQMQSSLKELQLSLAAPDADPTKDPAWEPCMQEAQRLQRLLQEVQSRHEADATPAQESASPRARERGVSAEPQPRTELRGPAQDGAGPATEDQLRALEERHAQALQDAHDQIQSLQEERQKVWEDAKVGFDLFKTSSTKPCKQPRTPRPLCPSVRMGRRRRIPRRRSASGRQVSRRLRAHRPGRRMMCRVMRRTRTQRGTLTGVSRPCRQSTQRKKPRMHRRVRLWKRVLRSLSLWWRTRRAKLLRHRRSRAVGTKCCAAVSRL